MECAAWSVISDFKWSLFKTDEVMIKEEFKKIVLTNSEIGFIYYHYDEKSPFVLIAHNYDFKLNKVMKELNLINPLNDWSQIMEVVTELDGNKSDFDKDIMVGEVTFQQCPAPLLDCLCGGIVAGLPKSGSAVAVDPFWYKNGKNKQSKICIKAAAFDEWCKIQNVDEAWDLRFLYGYEEKFFKKQI